MIKNKHKVFFLLIVLLLTSCYSYKHTGLLQEHNKSLPEYTFVPYENYRINVNDELVFRLITSDKTISKLIGNNQFSGGARQATSYRVFPDGTVDIPFVKNIPVAGLTIEEATKVIETRFKEIIPDATVKLTLVNKTFTVIGEAGTGVYPIVRDKLTLLQALSISGDIRYTGDYQHVKIIRETAEGVRVLDFDIRPASIIESEYYYIYPNDIIYVQKDPTSFFKVNNYSSFISLITSSLSLLFTVLYYFRN